MTPYELDDVVGKLVRRYLMWYRHYWGTVLSTADRLQVGRVQVQIPELRWNDQTTAPWCMPRYNPGISVPPQGSIVEVYFVEGNPSRPVWIGRVPEQGETVKAYTGPGVHVLFQDKTTGDAVLYNESDGTVQIIGNGDNLVTYSALATVFSNLATWLNAHVHTGVTTGPGSSGPPGASVSIDPSGAKAKHLLTNG